MRLESSIFLWSVQIFQNVAVVTPVLAVLVLSLVLFLAPSQNLNLVLAVVVPVLVW